MRGGLRKVDAETARTPRVHWHLTFLPKDHVVHCSPTYRELPPLLALSPDPSKFLIESVYGYQTDCPDHLVELAAS